MIRAANARTRCERSAHVHRGQSARATERAHGPDTACLATGVGAMGTTEGGVLGWPERQHRPAAQASPAAAWSVLSSRPPQSSTSKPRRPMRYGTAPTSMRRRSALRTHRSTEPAERGLPTSAPVRLRSPMMRTVRRPTRRSYWCGWMGVEG